MSRGPEAPINGSVLQWAIGESGFTEQEVAAALKVPVSTVASWVEEREHPRVAQLRKLAGFLKRPSATFFLPERPSRDLPALKFRRPTSAGRQALLPTELLQVREAARLQESISWLLQEFDEPGAQLPAFQVGARPPLVASRSRLELGVSVETQLGWQNEYRALAGWRGAFERKGILVFFLSLGAKSIQGFSLWDERAPVVAVNTALGPQARIFTMMHELGHLLTRSSSACLEGAARDRLAIADDYTERWCERFAAHVLLPWPAVERVLRSEGWAGEAVTELGLAKAVATRFRVSLRAVVLRLIEEGHAGWELWKAIPQYADVKRKGGGGSGTPRRERRAQQYGRKVAGLFVRAIREDLMSASDVLSHLRISHGDLESYERETLPHAG